MTYIVPVGPVLNLASAPYVPPPAAAVLFELGQDQDSEQPVVRRPPAIITSARFANWGTSGRPVSARDHHHGAPSPRDRAPAGHESDQARSLPLAARVQAFDRVPAVDELPSLYGWDRSTVRDSHRAAEQWNQSTPHDIAAGQSWDVQPAKDNQAAHGFNDPADHNNSDRHRHADSVLNWQPEPIEVEPTFSDTLNLSRSPYTPPGALLVDFELVPAPLLVAQEPPTRSVDARNDRAGWSLKDALDGRTIHPWDRKPRLNTEVQFPVPIEPDPVGDPPPEPEIKRTYVIMNASSLIALPSGTPLDFADLNISLDADSFAWSMSARILNRASIDLIRPTAEGPAEVIAMINGHEWRFVIERYSLDGRFAREQYQVSGVSRSQLLAAPYAPKLTGRVEAPINMSQLMAQLLEYTGFTVELQPNLIDYVIPAGAWGWDNKTAMEVIAELAASVGAVVVPNREADIIHIRHRYKQVGPWSYLSQPIENIDAIIADAMTTGYSSQWEPQPEYNAVFVSGVTSGVAVDVIRTGTPGDKGAPDIFDDLNVDPAQCRLRGLNAIAAGGNQEIVTIESVLPTSGAPGLIEPAMLVEFRDTREPDKSWRGNVLSNSVSVAKPGAGRVTQTVKVERHHYGNS